MGARQARGGAHVSGCSDARGIEEGQAFLEWAFLEWAFLEWAFLEWAFLEWAFLIRGKCGRL
jgi:hypothetical protein